EETGANVVGIGASAGGLEAFAALVSAIQPGSGFVWVIVQHLSPDHPSILDQLLQTNCKLPVRVIEDAMTASPDAVYVAPAGMEVFFRQGVFSLRPREAGVLSTPIDTFFSSLAEGVGRSAFAVVLSGTGSDGTAGVRAIKAAGGVALVQDSAGARFPGMPNAAAATGLVDGVLPAGDIPGRIADIALHRRDLEYPSEKAHRQKQIEDALPEVVRIVGEGSGHDFSSYKPGTLVRRIERRMVLRHISKIEGFVELLAQDEEEAHRLLQDFLIGVTSFYRDPSVWELVREQVVLPLLDTEQPSFRVWVPACSTGEEAYSIAILFLEALKERGDHRQVQVFGTDIDLPALTHARRGIYQPSSMAGVSEERRAAYFTPEAGDYHAASRLREACVFAPHNVIQDPPFSRLDFISCRNLLIYLSQKAQAHTIERFHFATRNKGYLLLGPSESLAGQEQYFDLLDKESRLFERNARTPPRYSPLGEQLPRPGQLQAPSYQPQALPAIELGREARAEKAFLENFAAPYALVTRRGEVCYLSSRMTNFVQPARGVPSTDINAYLTSNLRLPVRSALAELAERSESGKDEEPIVIPNIMVEQAGTDRLIDVTVGPVEGEPNLALVVLSEVRHTGEGDISQTLSDRDRRDKAMLQREVESLRKRLALMSGEYDTSSQELKSTNEELLSMNEELQSSNEELETSREELQSINEELETVNTELSENNTRLIRANSDLKNLFEATDIAVLFLDANLLVRTYTPAVERLFRIRRRDEGRPITDLTSRIPYPELQDDAEAVRQTLTSIEREVVIEATNEFYIVRIKPYRTVDNRLDGVVLTFFDVTGSERDKKQLEQNQRDLERQYAELQTIYDTAPVGLGLIDRDFRYLRINEKLAKINGIPAQEHLGRTQSEMLPDIDAKISETQRRVMETGEASMGNEVVGYTPAEPDRERTWIVDYYPIGGSNGIFAAGTCVREVTEERALMKQVAASEARLRRTLDNIVAFTAVLDTEGRVREVNAPALVAGGVTFAEVEGQRFWETYWWRAGPDTQAQLEDSIERAAEGEIVRYDTEVVIAQGGRLEIDFQLAPVRNEKGEVVELVASAFDITERNRVRRQMETLLSELQHRVKNTLATVSAVARFVGDRASSVDEFKARFDGRLGAISRTHDILTNADWRGANLSDIIHAEFAPYRASPPDRSVLKGDDLYLEPKEVLSIGMALHELVTNAVKYGALAEPDGWVEITASATGADWTDLPRTIVWKEHGGKEVKAPNRSGFGTFLIERVLASDLQGEARLHFEEDGLRCCIGLPDPYN
ncbi:MAG: chemotaxis protein CheB, partial [Parvularcula sp.]|nr:chemotaxis protein CheB [Parvularcula sp.]